MDKDIEIAQQALASLALFGRFYASSEPYQQHKAQVASLLEQQAKQSTSPAGGQLLRGIAAALRQQ